jgi:hypothetical protein
VRLSRQWTCGSQPPEFWCRVVLRCLPNSRSNTSPPTARYMTEAVCMFLWNVGTLQHDYHRAPQARRPQSLCILQLWR